MKKLLFLAVILSSFSAFASSSEKIVSCDFTEPFFKVNIHTDMDHPGIAGDKVLFDNFSGGPEDLRTVEYNVIHNDFTLVFAFISPTLSKLVLTIDLSQPGDNGMSDIAYDARAILSDDSGNRIVVGGCDFLSR